MEDKQITLSLSEHEYRLLQAALSAAECHPALTFERRHEIGRLGWAIHCQVNPGVVDNLINPSRS